MLQCGHLGQFEKLNKYQKDAVLCEDKALLLNASVGSGKTTVLVNKVLYLHYIKNVPLNDMVVLTFTNKAAEEIKQRIIAYSVSPSPIDPKDMCFFGTFHSVANYLLSNILPIESLGFTKDFTIVDNVGLSELFESVINKNNLNIKYKNNIESRLENHRKGIKHYGNMKYKDDFDVFVDKLNMEKKNRNILDFDDLIEMASKLLRDGSFKPSWIIIDEFQDTDDSQLNMIDGLKGDNTHIFAVGDPNQIIYTWRGSRGDMFDTFKERYNASVMTLPINYRSTMSILTAAKVFLDDPSSLEGIRDMGSAIVVKRHYDSFNEAVYIADKIKDIVGRGDSYKDIAIFYRMKMQSQVFEDVFKREKVPYEVSSQKTIKDIPMAYWIYRLFRVSINNRDIDSYEYVVCDKKYGIAQTKKQFNNLLTEFNTGDTNSLKGVSQKILCFKDWCHNRNKDHNIEKLEYEIYDYFDLDTYLSPTSIYYCEDQNIALRYLRTIKEYIILNNFDIFDGIKRAVNYLSLYGSQVIDDIIDPEKDSVKLMTLHASKGLEFKYVFISGANYGVMPLEGRFDDEEEKRLFFVGITRAKDNLEISYHSNPEFRRALPSPSPYLKMIPNEIIESEKFNSSNKSILELRKEIIENINKKQNIERDKRLVSHERYGNGYVISETDEYITVKFEGYGQKSFSKLFCPLTHISPN